jgi:2-haloacid dehalogenase
MTDSPRAILFDLGNVLVKWDLHPLLNRFFPDPQAVDSFLAEVSFQEWNAQQDKGRPFAEGVTLIASQFPRYAHLFQLIHEQWAETIREPIPETIALAQRLKAAGYSIYILSNSSAEKYPLARQIHPFLAMFDDAIISGEIGLLKPDPAIFHYTLRRIGRRADECLFIDDNRVNAESAREVGITAIHYQSPRQLEQELRNLKVI